MALMLLCSGQIDFGEEALCLTSYEAAKVSLQFDEHLKCLLYAHEYLIVF